LEGNPKVSAKFAAIDMDFELIKSKTCSIYIKETEADIKRLPSHFIACSGWF